MNAEAKAIRKMGQLIARAEREGDTKGYRENLGYDKLPKFESFIGEVGLPYSLKVKLVQVFQSKCDRIQRKVK